MTQENRTIHVNPAAVQCTLKPHWFVTPPNPPQYQAQLGTNTIESLIGGSAYLPEFKAAVDNAKNSIWITIWGFDPSLSLVMGASEKHKEEHRISQVLNRAAERGVEVKVLVFQDSIVNTVEPTLLRTDTSADGGGYNIRWVEQAVTGRIKNLQLLTRSGPSAGSPDYRKEQAEQELTDLRNSERYTKAQSDYRILTNGGTAEQQQNIDMQNLQQVFRLERDLSNSHQEHINEINRARREQGLSPTNRLVMETTVTDHQKMILIDHRLPAHALGFVQGFNFHSAYFDEPEHPYKNPNRLNLKKAPIQDIGLKVRGAVLQDLFHNFKESWNNSIGFAAKFRGYLFDTPSEITEAPPPRDPLAAALGSARRVPAQILRTWKQTGEFTIEDMYKKTLGNLINQFIYVEDQYFRYPEFAQAILARAKTLQAKGTTKKIHVFVVTNPNTIDSNSSEQASRADMLTLLNRSDANVTADQWEKQQSDEAQLRQVAQTMENAGVMVQIGILRTSQMSRATTERGEQTGTHYNPSMHLPLPTYEWKSVAAYEHIYIHSKLTIIDEAFLTLGSANWNLRSMRSDSELNIAVEDCDNALKIREDLWGYHMNSLDTLWKSKAPDGKRTLAPDWFEQWGEVMKRNDAKYRKQAPRIANLFPYYEKLDEQSRFG